MPDDELPTVDGEKLIAGDIHEVASSDDWAYSLNVLVTDQKNSVLNGVWEVNEDGSWLRPKKSGKAPLMVVTPGGEEVTLESLLSKPTEPENTLPLYLDQPFLGRVTSEHFSNGHNPGDYPECVVCQTQNIPSGPGRPPIIGSPLLPPSLVQMGLVPENFHPLSTAANRPSTSLEDELACLICNPQPLVLTPLSRWKRLKRVLKRGTGWMRSGKPRKL